MDILLFIFGIILFVGLVVLHEFGHAIAAKRNGVEVEEFGIGFPPRAWSKKLKNGTLFSVNWLPIGGFVSLKGEHDASEGPGTYGGSSLWVKTKILLAGIAVNWLTAVVIFTILALVGLPKIFPNQFTIEGDTQVIKNDVIAVQVMPDTPAQKSGLQNDDVIREFAGQHITSAQQLIDLTKANAGNTVGIIVLRDGGEQKLTAALNAQPGDKGYLGVAPGEQTHRRSTWSAPIVGVGVTVQFTYETLNGLGKTIAKLFQAKFDEAGANVAGPVGIISILKDSSAAGIVPVLFLIGVISLTLAVMNMLPIPALDGGRLFVTVLFRVLGLELTKKREELIQGTGMALLLGLVLLITIVDVGRIIK